MSDLLPPTRSSSNAPLPEHIPVWRPLPTETEPELENVDIKELLATIRRRWKLVSAITLASMLAAWVANKLQTPKYEAMATIRLEDTRKQMTNGIDQPQAVYGGIAMWADPILSQLQVLESRTVASEVVKQHPLGLRVKPVGIAAKSLENVRVVSEPLADTIHLKFQPTRLTATAGRASVSAPYDSVVTIGGVAFSVRGDPHLPSAALTTTSLISATSGLTMSLSAHQRKSTDVIDVVYVSDDPYQSQQVVNAAVQVFRDYNAQTAQAESRRRREFLGEQVARSDSVLRGAEQQLSDFRSREHLYGSDAQVTAQEAQLLALQDQRVQMAADREVYQRVLATIHGPADSAQSKALRSLIASPGLATNPLILALYQQLVTFELLRDSLTAGDFGSAPTDPDVQRATMMIAQTEQRLVGAVRSEVASLNERIAASDEQLGRNTGALDAMPAKQASEARLMMRAETIKRLTDQLRDDYQRASVSEAVEAGQVEVVDPAIRPSKPIGARLRTKLGLGLVLGLLFGAGAAFMMERMNTSIRRREEIEKLLHVPGLAIIPQIMPSALSRGRLNFAGLDLPFPPTRRSTRRNMGDTAALVTSQNMRSTSAEAFRTLRTNLIFSQAVQSLRTMVITSPSPQDGKTTTATNLAVTFAQQGLRVLLADCDLRRGRLHNVFRVAREPGMTQFLAGQASLEEVVRESAIERLSFVPAGTFPPNPSELLGSARTHALIDEISKKYDIVILDTPPVHVAGDALILGTIADGVILVLRAGNTERGAAQHAMQRLTNVGARVVGAVLNDPDRKVPQYGGYYYYDYYYGDEPQKA
jgi:tyrosine-protein kinase Etk/Wzc